MAGTEASPETLYLRAEAKRRERQHQLSAEAMSSRSDEEAPLEVENATCSECDEEYERPIVVVQGRRFRFGAALCPSCAEEANAPPPEERPSEDEILGTMADLGLNVRKHGRCTLDSWVATESETPVQAARDFVAEMLAAGKWDPVRGLLLFGETGTGKTHLATAIIRSALERGMPPARIVFDRADRLITTVQDTYSSGATEPVLAKRERALLWVVDDLGREKATPDVLRILTDLLSAREAHPTVVTSNCAPDELVKRFEKADGWVRFASRLGPQNFRAVRVRGVDRRFDRPGEAA